MKEINQFYPCKIDLNIARNPYFHVLKRFRFINEKALTRSTLFDSLPKFSPKNPFFESFGFLHMNKLTGVIKGMNLNIPSNPKKYSKRGQIQVAQLLSTTEYGKKPDVLWDYFDSNHMQHIQIVLNLRISENPI